MFFYPSSLPYIAVCLALALPASAATPSSTAHLTPDNGLSPIVATFPPMSDAQVQTRCRGFFRALQVRHAIAGLLGDIARAPLDFVTDLPVHLVEADASDTGADPDYVTKYMVAFGSVNPSRTAATGLFSSDKQTCLRLL